MIFSNFQDIATSEERKKVLYFAEEGIKSVLPEKFMPQSVRVSNTVLTIEDMSLSIKDKRIFVIGAGKASAAMAVELENIINSESILDGIVISNDTLSCPQKIKIHQADHPIPTIRGIEGTKKILEMKEKYNINREDLIIALTSGGGSSLMPYPIEEISLVDKVEMIKTLIHCGATNCEASALKKKISRVKGGKLAQYFRPATIISLILSDTLENDQTVIASGPLSQDTTTYLDVLEIIKKYNIAKEIPESILSFFEKNREKVDDEYHFDHVREFIVSSNDSAVKRIKELAEKGGIDVLKKSGVRGEAKDVAYRICADIFNRAIEKPTLFLFGGETTVALPQIHGRGGRNQEFVSTCLHYLQNKQIRNRWCIASIATDGADFIKESAGGIIDNNSIDVINKRQLNLNKYLATHNSYELLERINSNIYIGHPTGTNVCDIILLFITPR